MDRFENGPRSRDWFGDGQFLLFASARPPDLMAKQVRGKKRVLPVVATQFTETEGKFSPGAAGPPKWFAYTSDESGTNQTYVQAFVPGRPASSAHAGFPGEALTVIVNWQEALRK